MNTRVKSTQTLIADRYDDAATKLTHAFGAKTQKYQYVKAMIHIEEALKLLGVDLEDENFQKTPARFIKYLAEFLQPIGSPHDLLGTDFKTKHVEYHGMVTQTNIPFRGVCAHHLLPFMGAVSIGYIPSKRVVGLSKLSRLVRAIGLKSPGIQEVQTDEIADTIYDVLEPKGVIVVVSAIHSCMAARGVAVQNVPTITSTVRGVYRDVPAAREEFFSLIKQSHLSSC